MNQPLLYSKHNDQQRNDAAFVLNNYSGLIQWKNDGDDTILDVGCGTGDVTTELLLPLVPENLEKLIGIDICTEMVNFAKKHYENSKVSFEQMNIEADDIPKNFEEGFDHVFSFYCLHWIKNQRKAWSNILKMLKPGGDILLTFLVGHPLFAVFESLSKNERWMGYMKDFEKYFFPHWKSENPEKELEELLKQVGFQTKVCKKEERIYCYANFTLFKSALVSVDPFYTKIPENLRDNYFLDFATEAKRMNLVDANDSEELIKIPYKLFIVYASKHV